MDFSNISLKDFLFLIDNNYKLSKDQFNDLQRNKIIKYYLYDNDDYILYFRNNNHIKISIV